MSGGLLQLVTSGIQDAPLIGKPEVTFFKTVYKQHTLFSLCQNDRFIGNYQFGKEGMKVVEKNGDLLYNQLFKLEIPYFEILKNQNITKLIKSEYNINELSVNFMNLNCYIFNVNNNWYIIPEKIFKIGNFSNIITQIESTNLYNELLPEYITLTVLGNSVNFYNINESITSPIISLLRVESNYWEQFWLDFIDRTTDETYINPLQTLTSSLKKLYTSLRNAIYINYRLINISYKNNLSFATTSPTLINELDDGILRQVTKAEIERYYNFLNNFNEAIQTTEPFEADKIYSYCNLNNKNFSEYLEQYLQYTPLVFLLMNKMFYASNQILFCFWKKYDLFASNEIDTNKINNEFNYINEWTDILYSYQSEIIKNNNLKNIIYDEFISKYKRCENNIGKAFLNLNFDDYTNIYTKLKVFLDRFQNIPNITINFFSNYYPYKYSTNPTTQLQNDSYNRQVIKQKILYPNLSLDINKIDTNDLIPVNLEHIYAVVAEELLGILINFSFIEKANISFLVFWKNLIVDLLYKKFVEINNRTDLNNNPVFVPQNQLRKLTYYYPLIPGNMINSTYIHNMWYEMFFKSSWLGLMSIDNNSFIKLKENIFTIKKNNIDDIFTETYNDFINLSISNTYTYIYYNSSTILETTDNFGKYNIKDIIYNSQLNRLYIHYDNYYNSELTTITLTNITKNIIINFTSVSYQVVPNEKSFNGLYLEFILSSTYIFSNEDKIKLQVFYNNYVPIVNFYDNQITKPKINSTKYILMNKTLNNQINILKIVNNNIFIENPDILVNSSKILALTINYLSVSQIVPPTKCLCTYNSNIHNNNNLDSGTYGYAISFYTSTTESDISEITYINITSSGTIKIEDIVLSDNKNIIGRKIYRTKRNSIDLLLLTTITNNTDTTFIDNINDNNLGIDYTIYDVSKLTYLPQISTRVNKKLVKVVTTNNTYSLINLDNTTFILPTTFTNIKEIYLEEFNYPFEIITSNNFDIINNGTLSLRDQTFFSPDYLYYLVSSTNNLDTVKLIPSRKIALLTNIDDISIELIEDNSSQLVVDTYYYKISLYNKTTKKESLIFCEKSITTTNGKIVKFSNLPEIVDSSYDSYKFYRKFDNKYYFLGIMDYKINNIFIDNYSTNALNVLYNNPVFHITKPINTHTINRPAYFSIINSSTLKPSTFSSGLYKYEITYIGINNEETITSPYQLFNITDYLPQLNFTTPTDSRIIGWKIYRSWSETNETQANTVPTFYIATVNLSGSSTFIDTLSDNPPLESTITTSSFNYFSIINSSTLKPSTFPSGLYKYEITYIGINNTKTIALDYHLFNITNYLPQLIFTRPTDPSITGWEIYRSQIITDTTQEIIDIIPTFYIQTVYLQGLNLQYYIDTLKNVPPSTNIKNNIYNIIKIPLNDVVPNLNDFISHSTDYEFTNDKKLTDLNDYIFNKPLVMLANNSDQTTFTTEYDSLKCLNSQSIYFYNINFKLNSTSVITLNNQVINYIMPLSTQQFFIKPSNETYYKLNNDIFEDKTNLVQQKTFNPAFDVFNISYEFILTNYYYPALIDKISDKYTSFWLENTDYKKISDLIDYSITEYKNIFIYMLNNNNSFYGIIIKRLFLSGTGSGTQACINKFYDIFYSNTYINSIPPSLTLNTIKDNDYIKFSRNAIRFIQSNSKYENLLKDIITISNDNIIKTKFLSPVYKNYIRSTKLSNEYMLYIKQVSDYFMSHIEYINNNKDFLNLSNSNIDDNKYLSLDEIDQIINEKFYDYNGTSNITTLHPITDTQLNIVKITDKNNIVNTITDAKIISSNMIASSQYINNQIEDIYDDKQIKTNVFYGEKPDKFNYYGICSIDSSCKIIFDDKFIGDSSIPIRYIRFDDGNIYTGTYNTSKKRYLFTSPLPECHIINPVEILPTNIKLASSQTNLNTINISKINLTHIYEYDIKFESDFNYVNNNPLSTKILLGINLIDCTIFKISEVTYKLYIKLTEELVINEKKLIFSDNLNSFNISPDIESINVTNYISANYKAAITSDNRDINLSDSLLQNGTNYLSMTNVWKIEINAQNIDGFYFNYPNGITNTNINLPIYKKSSNAQSEQDTTYNYITHKILPSMVLIEYYAYSNFSLATFTQKLLDTNNEYYIMFVDLLNSKHFILKKKNISAYEIPEGNYHTWILPQTTLNFIEFNVNFTVNTSTGDIILPNDITLPNYFYYMVQGQNDSECFYYYDSGTSIKTNCSLIQYYKNITTTTKSYNKIYMLDNDLFNANSYQLVKSYKTRNCSENILTKNLSLVNTETRKFNFNTQENISFKSNLSSNILNISTFNDTICNYNDINEITVNVILLPNNSTNQILQPIILKKYQNIQLPQVTYSVNDIEYKSSIIPISTSTSYWTSNTLTSDLEIGKIAITSTTIIKSLSPNLILTRNADIYTLKIKTGYTKENYPSNTFYMHTLWKLQIDIDDKTSIFYIWVVFTNNTTTYNNFLNFVDPTTKIGITQPIIANKDSTLKIQNILTNYTIQNQNILIQENNDMILNIPQENVAIGYKYCENIRNIDIEDNIHSIVNLNFNGILNKKPIIISIYNNYNTPADVYNTIGSKIMFCIVTYTLKTLERKIDLLSKYQPGTQNLLQLLQIYDSRTDTIKFNSDFSALSLFVSFDSPLFVKNKITLIKIQPDIITESSELIFPTFRTLTITNVNTSNIPYNSKITHIISSYEKLYLEKNEIININNNFFIVRGLNIFNNTYELELISPSTSLTNNSNYINNGYYSYGVYIDKADKQIPKIDLNNLIIFNKNQKINLGYIYLDNNRLNIHTEASISKPLCGKFMEKPLKIKLLYSNNKFYLLDCFVHIKKFDKIILVNQSIQTLLQVINIRDNEIIFKINENLTNLISNTFYDFILPYQPYITIYTKIELGIIQTDKILPENFVIGIDDNDSIQLYEVINNNIINWHKTTSYYWIYILDINYKKNFSNHMKIPNNFNLQLNNQHPISINVTYEKSNLRFKLNDPSYFVSSFNWFYGQPVRINGIYSYITNITIETIPTSSPITSTSSPITSTSSPILSTYYIYLTKEINDLFNSIQNISQPLTLYISYSSINMYNYYFTLKFRYNFGIQLSNYDMSFGTSINVIRCTLKNDQLVFIDNKHNGKDIIFKYGLSITENEKINGILPNTYTNIYFYNYRMINQNGTINNFDTLIGTYYLLYETNYTTIISRIYLCQIKSGNKIKLYTNFINTPHLNSFLLNKLIKIKINYDGEFSYANQQIVQARYLPDIDMQPIEIINGYSIKFNSIVSLTNNKFEQKILFTGNNINTNIYSKVYLDSNCTIEVEIIQRTTEYYLISQNIISNNITKIYTKNINWLIKSMQVNKNFKDLNLSDSKLDFYINTKISNTEDIVQNILISKINKNDTKYKYKLLDNSTYNLNSMQKYKVNNNTTPITSIDVNNNIIICDYFIDNDNLEQFNNYIEVTLFWTVEFDTSQVFDQMQLFTSVKHLKLKLFEICKIKIENVCSYLKPWNKWSLLCTLRYVPLLNPLVYQNTYIGWNINTKKPVLRSGSNSSIYSDLTKLEVNILSKFITEINNSPTRKNYYKNMLNIQELFFRLLDNLLSTPDFYLDVVSNINSILNLYGYNAYFNGNNIIFNNDPNPPYITIDGQDEVVYYLPSEFTYDEESNIVYRSIENYNNISQQVEKWINKESFIDNEKTFGIGINKLLRYLTLFGTQLVSLLNNFSNPLNSTPNYYYLTPLKFIVAKIWETYSDTGNLVNLEKEFTDKLITTVTLPTSTNNIYSYIRYNYLFTMGFYGYLNYAQYMISTVPLTDINISDVIQLDPNGFVYITQINSLNIESVYKYKLNFSNNDLLSNTTYKLNFLNGNKINTSVTLGNLTYYKNQISFSSDYNIKPYDFYVLTQEKQYTISNTEFKGFLTNVEFPTTIDFDLIEEIYLRNNKLYIDNKETSNKINLLIPESIGITDVFEFRNIVHILNFSNSNNQTIINFKDNAFCFIVNQTQIVLNNIKFLLFKNSDNKYYITNNTTSNFNSISTGTIITLATPIKSTYKNQAVYEYTINLGIDNMDYIPIDSNYIFPLDFLITGTQTTTTTTTTTTTKIIPQNVYTYDNKILFYYTQSDYLNISNLSTTMLNTILHKKRIGENFPNEIVKLEKQQEFLYLINVIFPIANNTICYVYKRTDLNLNNGIFEPQICKNRKTSINFYHKNTSTYFSIQNLYSSIELQNEIGFIQKNFWTITNNNYNLTSNILSITLPQDFIFKKNVSSTTNIYYKINDRKIPVDDIQIVSNKIIIRWSYGNVTGNMVLNQYFIENIGSILKPYANRKYIATLEYKYQYQPNTNFYYYPFISDSTKFDNYLYLINTSVDTTKSLGVFGFYQVYDTGSPIYLIGQNQIFTGKIFDKIQQNNKISYIISLPDKINTTITYTFHTGDFILNSITSMSYYQDTIQFPEFHSQTELSTINLYMNESVNNYSILQHSSITTKTKPNKFYLVSYEKSELTNLFYDNKFKQNPIMEKIIEYEHLTTTTNIIPEWDSCAKIFSYIKLYFNDQLIEELNENTFNIDAYLYLSEENRNQLFKMCKFRLVDNKKWELYFPLIFYYSLKPGLSIPTVAMPYTEIRLKYLLNDIEYILSNDLTTNSDTTYTFTKTPEINITLVTDFILLDDVERKLFGNHAHEYIIDRHITYTDTIISSNNTVVKNNFSGLIKDFHFVTKPLSNPKKTYYTEIETNYDLRYNRYVKALSYYQEYKVLGTYTSLNQREYAIDMEIIQSNETLLADYYLSLNKQDNNFARIINLTNLFGWDIELLKFLMYIEIKYLSEIRDRITKNTALMIYLKYQYKPNKIIKQISPIESMEIKVNGTSLFGERDYSYFTNVIPYQKFFNSLPTGYYSYTFSLYPRDIQYSGHLNFSNFDDVVIKIKSTEDVDVSSDPYTLSIVTREYNILRIMSGHSSLAWL